MAWVEVSFCDMLHGQFRAGGTATSAILPVLRA
jgi:hypothetical protein